MSTLYQRVAPDEQSELTSTIESHGSFENEAAARPSRDACEQYFEHDGSKLTEPTPETTSKKGKVMLGKSLSAGHLLEWLIHFLAISISISTCLLHFLHVYWTDESTWTTSWRWASLDLNDILKALQFAAKAHEILMIASIGSIVLCFARRHLIGRNGIALGLLMTSYGIDIPKNMLSSKFWSALSFDTAAVGLGPLLLVSAILCQLVGPASAGVIQPSLDWWHVSDPYNGQKLPLYLFSRSNETYLPVINSSTWPVRFISLDDDTLTADTCVNETSSANWCPGFGLGAVQAWTVSNSDDQRAPNLTMMDSTGTQRALTADLIANGTAIAATQSNWVINLHGLFVEYIKHHHLGLVNSVTYPMFSADPIYAPVVQVQCHAVDANQTRAVDFFTDSLTNYTDSGAVRYDAQMSWPVPDEAWNFRSSQEDPVNFTWVDLSQGSQETATNMWHPSIGAVAKVPGSAADGTPNFYTIPCIVDARWAASSASYQPTISEMVMSNLSSPAAIALSSISSKAKANPRQQLGIGGAIQIGPEWAKALNAGRYSFSLWTDVPVIEAMLYSYVRTTYPSDVGVFSQWSDKDGLVNDTAQLMQAAANITATILSLAIADGLSRLSGSTTSLLVLNATGDGNLTCTAMSTNYFPIVPMEASVVAQCTSVRLQVQRYGWGYGWSIILILELFIHIVMVLSYAGYQVFLRFRGRWWATTAWDDAAELLMLAWDSAPTGAFREAEEAKSSLWAQNISVRERGGGEGDAIELVAGRSDTDSGGGLLTVGKKYV